MKYKLIIDKNAEEEIIAVVHAPSSLTQQIENLVCSYSGEDYIMGYRDDEMRKLAYSEIECITILNRKVIAIDIGGNHFSLKDSALTISERCYVFQELRNFGDVGDQVHKIHHHRNAKSHASASFA